MKANDAVLDIFLMDEAALLAKPGYAEALAARQKPGGFSPAHTLLKTLVEDFGVQALRLRLVREAERARPDEPRLRGRRHARVLPRRAAHGARRLTF